MAERIAAMAVLRQQMTPLASLVMLNQDFQEFAQLLNEAKHE
jgi:hypothetical protein